ncbi:hypothetical protein ACFQU1_05760 [Chelatococcus sp. GCM10030263]|uniref:hypothetical protein n=1 Tax=Chelatococcus sp. GCM10030263 TaxID=3273387 RepID=UPI003606F71D
MIARGRIAVAGLVLGMAGSSEGAEAAPLDRFTGSFSATGMVVEGPKATSHRVTCNFSATRQGSRAILLRGTCRAYLIISRTITASLVLAPNGNRVTGSYTGARVGTARLSGRMRGNAIDVAITWPKPLYGDTRADMRIVSPTPDQMRIVVTDRIGASGPVRTTTDLTLSRRRS